MKILKDILSGVKYQLLGGIDQGMIGSIVFDSRNVTQGCAFVAIRGTQVNGHDFISQVIEKGCKTIIGEQFNQEKQNGINYIQVKDSSSALSVMCANFYDNPSKKLKLVGITGTNGKTTTVTLLYKLLKNLGYRVGLISTIRVKINDEEVAATHTTPDPVQLNSYLGRMVEKGCEYCFMEVSSHAIDQKRIAGLKFSGGLFTNITHDHLDYHLNFKNYLDVKKSFFDQLTPDAFALVNNDDIHSSYMLQNTKALKKTFGLKNQADFKAKIIEKDFTGMHLKLDGFDFHTEKTGTFNAYNILGVYCVALLLGIDQNDLLQTLSIPNAVDGRFEVIAKSSRYSAIVDYAHTPDALENVIRTINEIKSNSSKLITVFGCGGNRDKAKRPEMGKIAAELSEQVIITSDNPRFEDPNDIIKDIEAGLNSEMLIKSITITDREQAIKTACLLAKEGDIILVAGKGHENYQEIKGIKSHFDDKEILMKYLKE